MRKHLVYLFSLKNTPSGSQKFKFSALTLSFPSNYEYIYHSHLNYLSYFSIPIYSLHLLPPIAITARLPSSKNLNPLESISLCLFLFHLLFTENSKSSSTVDSSYLNNWNPTFACLELWKCSTQICTL